MCTCSIMLCEARKVLETLAESSNRWGSSRERCSCLECVCAYVRTCECVCAYVRTCECVCVCVCVNGHQGKDMEVIDMKPWIFKSASLCWKVSRFVSRVTEWRGKLWGYYHSKNLILTTMSQRWHRDDYGYRFRNNEVKDLEGSAGIRSLGSSCSWKQMTRLLGKLQNLLN